ncbi:uncharacterized protein LTR77_007758 [Saxophila tyrrhenica]|uniref:Cytochrome P450 n=1 Tax=Saxophila tyrrhenica TaxID=1690608 RepID=A0AAV9P317_9PEZI|nr:hypothetical protein LTR77_007758 [Saxophila tyrrhenica]
MAPYLQLLGGSAVLAYILQRFSPYPIGTILTTVILFSASFTAYAFWYVVVYPKFLSPLRHLPTPPDNAFFTGQTKQIMREASGIPMRKWNDTVPNEGLLRYSNWFQDRVLVTGPKQLGEVLVTKNYDFVKPRQFRHNLGRILGVGILLAEGDEHKMQRKNLMPAFAFRHIKNLYPSFWSKSREMTECVAEASKSTVPHSEKSKSEDSEKAAADAPQHAPGVLEILGAFVPPQILTRLPIKRNNTIDGASQYIKQVCRDLIASKRAKLAEKEETGLDIISVALESGGFTDEELVNQMMTFLIAGHETTATAMQWALYLLCKNPEAQEKLRQEVRSKLPSPDEDLTAAELDNCNYLRAVCTETLRLCAPVSLTLRVADRDTSIGGQFIPKDTTIILAPCATNTSKQLWGEDALDFKPERWLDADGKANNKGGAESNFAMMTFLHGPRSCIGQKFAQAEFECLLAAWVGRFETTFEEGSPFIDNEPEIKGGITSKPKGGLWVRCKEVGGW